MYTITGKQKYGAVWANGICVAMFQNGKAHTNDTDKAEILRKMGYMVTGLPEETVPAMAVDSTVSEGKLQEESPKMGVNPKKNTKQKPETE